MINFLKENTMFVVSSAVFLGLFAVVSTSSKIPIQNQINITRAISTSTVSTDPQESEVVPNVVTTTQPINIKTATKKVSNPKRSYNEENSENGRGDD